MVGVLPVVEVAGVDQKFVALFFKTAFVTQGVFRVGFIFSFILLPVGDAEAVAEAVDVVPVIDVGDAAGIDAAPEVGGCENVFVVKIIVQSAIDAVVGSPYSPLVVLLQDAGCGSVVHLLVLFAAARLQTIGQGVVEEKVDFVLAVVHVGTRPKVVGIARNQVKRSVESLAAVFFQHDVDDARLAFSLVTSRWVGDHFHLVDQTALQLLQTAATLKTHQPRGLAIDEDAYIVTAPQFDVPFTIHRNGGDVAEDIGGGTARVGQVFAYVEDFFVEGKFHSAFFRGNQHFFQDLSRSTKVDGAQVEGVFNRTQTEAGNFDGLIAQKLHHGVVVAVGCFE